MRHTSESLAAKRVGSTPEDQARWLIDLAYRYDATSNLSTLPSEDVDVISEELEAFLPDDPARPHAHASDGERESYAIRWLTRIRNGVRQLNKGQAWGHRLVTHYSFWVPLEGQMQGHYTPDHRFFEIGPQSDRLTITKTLKDAMAHKICVTLASMKASLRRCPRQGCGRLFIRHKRQVYCTPSCASLVRTRRHRNKQREVQGTKIT